MCNNCVESRKAAEKMAEDMSSADKSREFYRRQGECRERERIIKLLEETVSVYLSDKLLVEAAIVANNITLIKGETK